MLNQLMKFVRDEDGLTAVEYAIAGGLVGAGAIAAFRALGLEVADIIQAIANVLSGVEIS